MKRRKYNTTWVHPEYRKRKENDKFRAKHKMKKTVC